MSDTYEIRLHHGEWVKVAYSIFRSFTGARCINGKGYQGPRFLLNTDTIAEGGVMHDLCTDCAEVVTHYEDTPKGDILCHRCDNSRRERDYADMEYMACRDA